MAPQLTSHLSAAHTHVIVTSLTSSSHHSLEVANYGRNWCDHRPMRAARPTYMRCRSASSLLCTRVHMPGDGPPVSTALAGSLPEPLATCPTAPPAATDRIPAGRLEEAAPRALAASAAARRAARSRRRSRPDRSPAPASPRLTQTPPHRPASTAGHLLMTGGSPALARTKIDHRTRVSAGRGSFVGSGVSDRQLREEVNGDAPRTPSADLYRLSPGTRTTRIGRSGAHAGRDRRFRRSDRRITRIGVGVRPLRLRAIRCIYVDCSRVKWVVGTS